jgi:hypothetical protein
MMGLAPSLDATQWAAQQFAELDLGDIRRDQRVVTIAAAMAAYPGGSLPQLFTRWADLKAAYQLFAHASSTPDELQATHRELVHAALAQPGTYLLPEDTTDLSWKGRAPIQGLGPIGPRQDGARGYLLHSVLALRWPSAPAEGWPSTRPPVEVLGLAGQSYQLRVPRPKGEARSDWHASVRRARESQIWSAMSAQLGPAPDDARVRWVRVADRGADIYEFLRSCEQHQHGYVVRAAQDRVVLNARGQRQGTLRQRARAQAACGEFELELRARPQQAARTAHLLVSAVSVNIQAPQRPGGRAGSLPSVACTVVRVWEPRPPKGAKRLEWYLLCDGERSSWLAARACSLYYATRWLCEEFHKALKTGLQVEQLQLKTGAALMAATAIKSIVALRLVAFREQVQQQPTSPAGQSGLSSLELTMLRQVSGRALDTVREVALALGNLGGHLNRKRDGLPGWQTLWRGWVYLQNLLTGAQLANSASKKFG